MKHALAVLLLVALLPAISAENATEDDAFDVGQSFNEYMELMTSPFNQLGGGDNQTGDDDVGGGGDPFSNIKDPIIREVNRTFNTRHGWIAAYAIIALALTFVLVPSIMGGILGFIGFAYGQSINSPHASLFAIALFFFGFMLGLIFVKRSKKVRRLSKGLMIVLVVVLILLICYLIGSMFNVLPSWMV